MTIAYFLTSNDAAFAEPLMPRLMGQAEVLGASLFTPDKAEDPYAVLEALRGKAHVQLIGASPHPAPTAVPIGAVAEEELGPPATVG